MTENSSLCLVTGVGGGIGNAIAENMKADGYRVIGLDLGQASDLPVDYYYPCDLTDLASVKTTLDQITDEVGRFNVLVNNAGYYKDTPFLELAPEQIQTTLAVNVTAVLFTCQYFTRKAIESGKGGVIVNIASIAGRNGSSQIDYGASKAGVINLTKTLGRELAQYGIRINGVAPALVEAGMGTRLPDAVKERLLAATPLKRGADPSEVARVVSFLVSEAASYLTGTTIDVDGGL